MALSLPHPDTYSAYAFMERGGDLQKIIVKWRDPNPGEIVVKVLACGICATDGILHTTALPVPIQFPRVPGHEIVGDVVAVSATETKWQLGQRVGAGWHGGHCHTCPRCVIGEYFTCSQVDINGILRDGGYAEYIVLRSEAMVAVPRDLEPTEVAPLMCAGMTCFNSLRNMDAQVLEYVAIQGVGGVGHLGIQIAKAMGFRVIAISSSGDKEAVARELGAHEYIDCSKVDPVQALQALGGAKVIMCTVPDIHAAMKLLPGLAVDGTLLPLTLETEPIVIPPIALHPSRYAIKGWGAGVAKDIEVCLTFAQAQNIRAIVETFPLDRAQEAYNRLTTAKFRAVIVPNL
ncbi:GroES-like protein [Dichomitus squalens LYAD-421 SS1]|uniref:GroES-like protein n=1 Tax=Dichomitus squalens (strain LYAD-421) TaxID=732165 RepID=R7SZX4_DICSQ|nr:GroES-like protein [Dichomitus squalens LYAD-421 SS1]EJF61518.1 GroES-like protein [Dichomitus squalens LYAD-421 SS1]